MKAAIMIAIVALALGCPGALVGVGYEFSPRWMLMLYGTGGDDQGFRDGFPAVKRERDDPAPLGLGAGVRSALRCES